jgi:hypothetical protein
LAMALTTAKQDTASSIKKIPRCRRIYPIILSG